MTAPAKLVAVALLLWGWSIGQLVLGIVLGLAFEVARAAGLAERFAPRARLIARACAAAAMALLVYAVVTQSPPQSLYTWLRWLPLLLLPLAVVSPYRGFDTTHAYAAIVLAAAGTGNGAAPWLYAGYALLVGWALLARLPRARLALAAVMLVAAAAFGHAIHTGIWLLQGRVEELGTELFLELLAGKPDPFRERTRIGDMGRIKLSDRILMRVEVPSPRPSSILLRESAFEHYRNGEWRSARPTPRALPRDGDRWVLSDEPATNRLTVRRSISGGEGLLPLPAGTRTVGPLAAEAVELFASGAARVRGSPRFVAFDVTYDPSGERDLPKAGLDLDVPESLAVVLERTIAANALRQPTARARVEAVSGFFGQHFAYSLDLGDKSRTLADFLLADRKGHCEYFATATVMLLRALGVPARYVAGYSVQEYSELERAFIVRNRHAHAWVAAFVDGRWIEVDTTPAAWADLEAEESRSFLGPVLDLFSWMVERVLQGWLGLSADAAERLAAWALAGVIVVSGVLGLGWWLRRNWRGAGGRRDDAIGRAWRAVERRLARAGRPRASGETAREWAHRVGDTALKELAGDYYRARFDPAVPPEAVARFIEAARGFRPSLVSDELPLQARPG